jgi:hypothetical protein
MPAKTPASELIVTITPDDRPAPEPPVYHAPPKPASDPLVRMGLDREGQWDDPSRCLYQLQRWHGELRRREGGDRVDANWASDGYTLKEVQAVVVALGDALAAALAKKYK